MNFMAFEFKEPMNRDLLFSGIVDEKSIAILALKIIEINRADDEMERQYGKMLSTSFVRPPIKIYIDTYGGYVYQMLGIVGIIENSTTVIHTIATGAAMSCGFIMLIVGHRRFAYKYATPMYHQLGSSVNGKLQDIVQDVKQCEVLQKTIDDIVIRHTKIKRSQLKECRKLKTDWFMKVDKALKLGVIDEIM